MPAEIPLFEGTILVFSNGIKRSWNAGQMFGGMEPTITLEGTLPSAEVEALLTRIAAAVAVS